VWEGFAWTGVVTVLLALLGAAMLIALRLRALAPLAVAAMPLTSAGTGVRTAG
jgi:hypothetical protein